MTLKIILNVLSIFIEIISDAFSFSEISVMDGFYADEDISSLPQRGFEFLNDISHILFIEIMQGITGVYYVIVILNEYIFSNTSKNSMYIQSFFFRKHLQSIQSVLRKIKSIHLKSLFCKVETISSCSATQVQ